MTKKEKTPKKLYDVWLQKRIEKRDKKETKPYITIFANIIYIYFLFIFFSVSLDTFKHNEWFLSLVSAVLFVIGSSSIVSSLFIYVGYKKDILSKIEWLYKTFMKNASKELSKTENTDSNLFLSAFLKMIYIIVFFFIPLFFLSTFLTGKWEYRDGPCNTRFDGQGFNLKSYETCDGIIKVHHNIEDNLRLKLSYFLGNRLDLPIFDVCFINNGFKHNDSIDETTFNSKVTVENKNYQISLNDKICIPTTINKKDIKYKWFTDYNFNITCCKDGQGTVDFTKFKANNFIRVNINENFTIMSILIILFWLGVCHLIVGVIKDFRSL